VRYVFISCEIVYYFVYKKTGIGDDKEKHPFFNGQSEDVQSNCIIRVELPDVILLKEYIPD
jgi:hypothetical protein